MRLFCRQFCHFVTLRRADDSQLFRAKRAEDWCCRVDHRTICKRRWIGISETWRAIRSEYGPFHCDIARNKKGEQTGRVKRRGRCVAVLFSRGFPCVALANSTSWRRAHYVVSRKCAVKRLSRDQRFAKKEGNTYRSSLNRSFALPLFTRLAGY